MEGLEGVEVDGDGRTGEGVDRGLLFPFLSFGFLALVCGGTVEGFAVVGFEVVEVDAGGRTGDGEGGGLLSSFPSLGFSVLFCGF